MHIIKWHKHTEGRRKMMGIGCLGKQPTSANLNWKLELNLNLNTIMNLF